MKKFILLLILGTVGLIGYSQRKVPIKEMIRDRTHIIQVKKEIIYERPKSEISIQLIENKYYAALPYTYFRLFVNCRVHCSEWKSSTIIEIFDESTYSTVRDIPELHRDEVFKNEKTVDSLFQNLYDWIKEIEDFAISHRRVGDKINMEYHDIDNGMGGYTPYWLKKHIFNIEISTTKYLADQAGYWCERWTKMKSKTITEIRKCLLDYTSGNNINIKL